MNSMVRTLANLTGNPLHADVAVADLRLDSRQVRPGDVFFAVTTSQDEGQRHVREALAAGAVAVVHDADLKLAPVPEPAVSVAGLRNRLGAMADGFYDAPSSDMPVIGITGTNGKTSCSNWIAQAWSRVEGEAGFMGTLGCGLFVRGQHDDAGTEVTGLTTADVLANHRLLRQLRDLGAKAVAMEVSSHALEQGRVDGIRFDTAVFTNLSRDHLDYHGNMDSYGRAKKRLFLMPGLQQAIINADDTYGRALAGELRAGGFAGKVLTYAIHAPESDIGVERFEVTVHGVVAEIRTPWGRGALQSRYPGGFNLLNVLAVVGTLCGHGMDLQTVMGVIKQLQAVPGRTQIVSQEADDILVVVDYAHTPDALEKVLMAVDEQCANALWCVFGCGGNRDRGKRPLMGEVAGRLCQHTIVTSDNPRDEQPGDIIADILTGCPDATVIEDRAAAIAHAILSAEAGDAILVAGKGHEAYQEVAGHKLPFSDVVTATVALKRRRAARAGGITA